MKDYVILTDVTSDMSPEVREYFGVTDYIHGYVHISDGRDYTTLLDWSQVSRDDFYRALNSTRLQVTTAPASPEEYYEKLRSYAERGIDVLSLSLSGRISSTYGVASAAAERVRGEFPEAKIITVDSCRMTGALGMLTAYAHALKNEGKTIDEVAAWLEENKVRAHQMGPIDDLMVVARRGRISKVKAIFGSLAGVKPMGDCNEEGYVTVLGKAKGIKRALAATVEYIREVATDIENQYIFITHTDREQYASDLAAAIERELHPKRIFVSESFSASATNIGPGMIGAYFMGEPVSPDNEREKAVMESVLSKTK